MHEFETYSPSAWVDSVFCVHLKVAEHARASSRPTRSGKWFATAAGTLALACGQVAACAAALPGQTGVSTSTQLVPTRSARGIGGEFAPRGYMSNLASALEHLPRLPEDQSDDPEFLF